MINVYVVWVVDGPIMTTLLQYDDTPENRKMVKGWSTDQIVQQAKDVEEVDQDETYELAAIFTADNLDFIY
jgi:hypothetical protein